MIKTYFRAAGLSMKGWRMEEIWRDDLVQTKMKTENWIGTVLPWVPPDYSR